MRLKIYCLLATSTTLIPDAGDRINEINLLKTLSTFCDVYYNDQLFLPNQPDYGLKPLPINVPTKKYDLYYVRNNPKIFKQLPHPKITVAVPYDNDIYKISDSVIVYTEEWKRRLLNKEFGNIIPKHVTIFEQNYDNIFHNVKNHKKTLKYRQLLTNNQKCDFLVGNFGRISESRYPYSFLHILPKIIKKYPDKKILVVYSGQPRQVVKQINHPNITFIKNGFNYSEMPYVLSACDLITSDHRTDDANFCGCRHVLECMACGIPVITGDFTYRKYQLGDKDEYPLYWDFDIEEVKKINNGRVGEKAENKMFEKICWLIENPEELEKIGKYLLKRSYKFNMLSLAKQLKIEINKLVK